MLAQKEGEIVRLKDQLDMTGAKASRLWSDIEFAWKEFGKAIQTINVWSCQF